MQHISIVLNGVKRQFDNIIPVIHASRNSYDLVLVSSFLLNAKARQVDLLFVTNVIDNLVVNHNSSAKNNGPGYTDLTGSTIATTSSTQSSSDGLFPTPAVLVVSQSQNFNSGRGRSRGCGYGNNRPQCQLCEKFGHLVHRFYHHFNVNFTGVKNPGSSSPPSVNLCSTQWEDPVKSTSSAQVPF